MGFEELRNIQKRFESSVTVEDLSLRQRGQPWSPGVSRRRAERRVESTGIQILSTVHLPRLNFPADPREATLHRMVQNAGDNNPFH